jgi:thiol-disulfide isomerase/thioredoxin
MNTANHVQHLKKPFKRFNKAEWAIVLAMALVFVPLPIFGSDDLAALYSYGQGPTEVYIFSDYFCPPCQRIEPYMERVLPELLRHDVKILFVDMPVYRATPLYSRYFLYSARASGDFARVLEARRVLFDLARTKAVTTDQEIIQELRSHAIEFRLVDTKPVFDQWRRFIERFDIRSTPTCVVVKPGQEHKKYTGSDSIQIGLGNLASELTADNKG